MSKRVCHCKKCNGFGAYNEAHGGRVHRTYCSCKDGKRFREKIEAAKGDMTLPADKRQISVPSEHGGDDE